MKENDIILNMLANPEFTVTDFQSVGLTGDNTGLRSEEEYKSSEKIRNNEYFHTNGEFDEAKFHNFYVGAGQFYNQLATQNYEQAILDKARFSKDNIWVEPEKRTIEYAPKLVRTENEHLVTNSLERVGKRGQRTLSLSEIALTLKVYNTETGEWEDSPNDSFFDNFFDTLVLATYDEDEYDEKGKLIHQKGERKLNEEGLPYYETLGGRDVYGKQVLSKFNMLTTDDSIANRYDFFDTDDIEQKSFAGTVMRNAALVGSMFIPGIGPWIAGLSVATLMTGLLATFGKLFAGNDSALLNDLQGWAKTVNRSGQTEYAANNTWCTENLLNMIGDTIGQLKEQRWIFKSIPTIMGQNLAAKALSGSKGYNQVVADIEKELAEKGTQQTTKKLLGSVNNPQHFVELENIAKSFKALNNQKAINAVDDLVKAATDMSSPLARAYMVGITVQDTYGEAKAAGASDLEAALLTIGYAAGEAAILNTELGKWIMPELQSNNYKYKAIANALTKDVKEAYGQLAKDGSKQGFALKLMNFGRDIAKGNYAQKALAGVDATKVLAANAITESTEEVSEELLADVSKSIFNVTRWLRGEESLDLGEWDNMFDRYAMSALGGFVGGGIASAGTDFKQARDLSQMDKTRAMHEILYMVNNNKEGEFISQLEKMNFGNKNLSAQKIIDKTEDGNVIYAEGTPLDNLDREIKNIVKGQIKLVKDILESEGAKLSTLSLLNKLTLEELKDIMGHLRYINLQNARSLDLYLNDFAEIQSQIVSTKAEIMKLNSSIPDSAELTSAKADKISALEAKLKDLRIKKDAYIKGETAPEAIRDVIFEMNPLLSGSFAKTNLKMYAEHKLGKKWKDLSDSERKEITQAYKTYSETTMKNDIHTRAAIFLDMMELFSLHATEAQDFITNLQKTQGLAYRNLLKLFDNFLANRYDESQDSDEYLMKIQAALEQEELFASEAIGRPFFSDTLKQQLIDIQNNPTLSPIAKADLYQNTLFNGLLETLDINIAEFVKLQYIHPEVKNSLNNILNTLELSLDNLFLALMDLLMADPDIGTPEWLSRFDNLTTKWMPETSNQIKKYKNQINNLRNTPILEYLNRFLISTTNSDLNITKHLENILPLVEDAKKHNSIDELLVNPEWEEDNEEALLLIDSFISVMNGLRVDNADLTNPTGYSKILNEVYQRQGIKNYIKLAELDSQTVDLMLQDALLIKKRLEFVQDIHNLNKGLKLKLQDKVAVNKQYLTFNALKNFVKVAVPDDWIAEGSKAKDVLQGLIDTSTELLNLTLDDLKLDKEKRRKINAEMVKLEDAIYDIFNENKEGDSWNLEKLKTMLDKLASMDGFFQKTGDTLTEYTKFLDNNSFIWWLASKAAMKSSDFYGAYVKSLSEDLAPIASQEMAVQLGVAAITNMNALNSFVDAYRNVVVEKFKAITDVNERKRLLNNYHDGSHAFADQLLDYFASYNALPQFLNMVFIEGIPGSGKSGGVFKSISAVVNQILPDLLDNAIYAHATHDSAEKAANNIGLTKFSPKSKEELMTYISSEWRDVLKNPKNKDNKVYLYDDSYEFVDGRLVNKWKVNKVSDAPRVMFIDEVSHYNQLELAMIELFAKENGVVVLTAGDLDLDSLVSYFADKSGKDLDVSIDRNYFIRTPKLGLTLRALNKQMTHDITMMQAAMLNLKEGKSINLNFSYLDNDEKHKGLYGVKVAENLDKAKETILLMIDTATDKVGFIYLNEGSELYKYLMSTYGKDKINFFKGSEAQGLEGLYYIVEPNIANTDTFAKSLYTGISRAEQGALVLTPGGVGNVTGISSQLDPNFQLEPLPKSAIKKASEARKEELEELLNGLTVNPITVIPPTIATPTSKPTPPKPGGLPPTPPAPPAPRSSRIGSAYTDKVEAQNALNDFELKVKALANPILVKSVDNTEFTIKELKLVEDTTNNTWTPTVTLNDDSEYDLDTINKDFQLKDKTTGTVAPVYNIGDKLVIEESGVRSEIIINDIDKKVPVEYLISNLDGTNSRRITLEDLLNAFLEYYTEPEPEDDSETIPDNGLENDSSEYEAGISEENASEENFTEGDYSLYTFNNFLLGIALENGKLVYKGDRFTDRIDNAIGIMNLFNYKPGDDPRKLGLKATATDEDVYKHLERMVANLRNATYYYDNVDLLKVLKASLNLTGDNLLLIYAIKSTAGENNHPDYGKYYKGLDEKASYIYSDDPDADNPLRKDLVLLVKNGDNTVFELSLATLGSPLTMMLLTDIDGNPIYDDAYKIYNRIYDPSIPDSLYLAINEVISKLDGQKPYLNLINLFKLWQFTSNGIFYFGNFDLATGEFKPSNFSLSKLRNFGPQLVKLRGGHLLNGKLQFNGQFIDLDEFAKNPSHNISSIFTVKDDIPGINKGHSFVLVSDNPRISTDEDLTREYMAGNRDVLRFYILPPKATVSDWITNEQARYLKNLGNTIEVQDVGNGFTAYRILQALLKSGKFDQFNSSDGTKNEVKAAVEALNAIEDKWNLSTINFSNEVLENKMTDAELYDYYKKIYASHPDSEKWVRRTMRIIELRHYLDSKNNWGKVPITPDKTINQALTSYLTGIVYKKVVTGSRIPSFNEDLSLLQKLNEACKLGGLEELYYKAKKSKDSVGPHKEFIKILTSNKYTMFSKDGKDYKFQINAKIDTPTISSDALIKEISRFTYSKNNWNSSTPSGAKHRTTHFYFDGNTWKLTDLGKQSENNYLAKGSMVSLNSTLSTIKSEYSEWFKKGYLDESVIVEGDKIVSLRKLANALNLKKSGIYGFEHQGKLYLYEFKDVVPTSSVNNILSGTNELYLEGTDKDGNIHEYTITPNINNYFITELEAQETILKPIPMGSEPFAGVNEVDFTNLKNELIKWNENKPPFAKKMVYLQKILTLGELITILQNYNNSLDENFNGLRLMKSMLESDIKFLSSKLTNNKVLSSILKYVNEVGGLQINLYDIVRVGNSRAKVIEVGDNFLNIQYEPFKSDNTVDATITDLSNARLEEVICKPKILKLLSK